MKLSNLTNPLWWKDAGLRAAYTALAVAVPYLAGSLIAEVPWVTLLLIAALAFLASIVTSLAGLPEVEGVHLPWWLAAVERVVKTFAQSLAAGFVGAVLITDVDWTFVLQAAALAALASLVRLILATLPADPTKGTSIRVEGVAYFEDGTVKAETTPVLAPRPPDPHTARYRNPGAHNE